MSCTSPQCYLVPREGGRLKKLMIDWPVGDHPLGRVVYLPCGGCLACRRERRQELTLLQCCEASLYDDNWFITLTYDDQKTFDLDGLFPYSLSKKHLQTFNELMRKYCKYYDLEYRFFACGEYGDLSERPHYHLSVFGLPAEFLLSDSLSNVKLRKKGLSRGKLFRISEGQRDSAGQFFWQSKIISDRWPYGSHQIYRANRETFQYVAGYVTKKLTGQLGRDFEATGRIREFQVQSRPSIGFPWFYKYYQTLSQPDGDKLVNDCLSIAGCTWKTPRIFGRWYEQIDKFDGKSVADFLSSVRVRDMPSVPDREDLKRLANYDRYSQKRLNEIKRLHKEVK